MHHCSLLATKHVIAIILESIVVTIIVSRLLFQCDNTKLNRDLLFGGIVVILQSKLV
jgi:hypothetical protein